MCKTENIPYLKELPFSECTITDNRLYFQDRFYVPVTMKPMVNLTNLWTFILKLAHDSVESGYPGKNKLYKLVHYTYFWSQFNRDMKQFIHNCYSCIRNKTSWLQYQDTLKPLPIPLQRWRELLIDFVRPIQETVHGFDMIMVMVDRLSKDQHYILIVSTIGAYKLVMLFVQDM
jgi:hypothetical protein